MNRKTLLGTAMTLAMIASPGFALYAQEAPTDAPAPAPVPAQPRPSVLIWMLDDVGFAQLSSYGGLVETPNIDRVARSGLRYSNYHTAPICSASRAAILTGRNPHTVHMGGHAAAALPYPGYDSIIPAGAGTLGENLRQAGYVTFALGKWDHLPSEQMMPAGPYRLWPSGQGFDRFYGFLAADTDNWNPVLIQDNSPVAKPDTPNYHLNLDLADRARSMIATRRASDPLRPFFMYFATSTAHAPHHAPQEWIDRYKGKFDDGWDKARERILEKQISMGLVPRGTKLAERPEGMPAWNELNENEKRLFARQMEVFAASLEYADAQFGRILDALEESGELNNTIVMITSDNGASAEGAYHGTYNETLFTLAHYPSVEENLPFIDRWGGADTYPHYALGWAVAGNTPLKYYKQTAHEGGTRVPLVVSWPSGITARGEIRDQFVYVTDIMPTILDLAEVQTAALVNNVEQMPMDGMSFSYTLSSSEAPDQKGAQYFEMYGNKGLWSGGYTIVTTHRTKSWDMTLATPPDEPWELYNTEVDPGQRDNLATSDPAKVDELAQLFDIQARRYNVYPISNMSEARPVAAARLQEEVRRRRGIWSFATPTSRIAERAGPPITTMPFHVEMDVTISGTSVSGPLMAVGGKLGGMALFLDQGKPVFAIRDLGGNLELVAGDKTLSAGTTRVSLEIDRSVSATLDPIPLTITIRADDEIIAYQKRILSVPPVFGVAETLDFGIDWGSAVGDSYQANIGFTGEIKDIKLDFNRRNSGQGR